MRVGIDGRAFTSPAAGVRRYVHALVPALQAVDGSLEMVALGGRDAPAGVEQTAEPWHPPSNPGWALIGLPRAAAQARVDLIHAPAYTGPLWAHVPVVLTIHDVSYERHPEWYPYRRDRLRRAFYRRCARAATHLLTDSEFSAGEIMAAYGIDRNRLTVAPLGVTSAFSPPPSHPSHPPSPFPPSPFLLHVGDLHERRNLSMVLEAVLQARTRTGEAALSLVAAGVDRGVGDALDAQARAAGAAGAFVRLGEVSEQQLRELYRSALAFVYPSRYEGFGLPVLEAMASGTPVIAARAASIPEVLGDAGTLLEPDDVAGWADAIVAIACDEGLRANMRTQGVARAAEFTWARTARITAGVYRRVIERHGA